MEGKTPVTLLQELLLKHKTVPSFVLIHNGGGSHDPLFKYEVSARGKSANGSGKSKKEAKHDAARNLLNILKHEDEDLQEMVKDDISSPYEQSIKTNAVGSLNEFCINKCLDTPDYRLTRDEGLPHAKIFSIECLVSSFKTEATSRTKKQAKQLAAQAMLEKLQDCIGELANIEPVKFDTVDCENTHLAIEKLKKLEKPFSPKPAMFGQVGLKISELYQSLTTCLDSEVKLENLESIVDKSEDYFDELSDPKSLLKTIVNELQYVDKLHQLPTLTDFAVALELIGPATWTFLGTGKSNIIAERDAVLKALFFLSEMVSKFYECC